MNSFARVVEQGRFECLSWKRVVEQYRMLMDYTFEPKQIGLRE